MRIAINALCIRANRVLLVRKKDAWILPGGKPNPGEDDYACLAREKDEELPKATMRIDEKFGEFTGITPHSKTELTAKVYLADIEGDLTPGAEISESRYFAREDFGQLYIPDITKQILDAAVETGHLT